LPVLIAASFIAIFIIANLYFAPSVVYPPFYGWFPFGWFFVFPLIFLVFFGFRWFFWGWGRGWSYGEYYDPAMAALRERFARGEISKEQFEQMSKDLEN